MPPAPSLLISTLPYPGLDDLDPNCSRVHGRVSKHDRRTILSAVGGDHGITNFIIQHAFLQTVQFIRANGLTAYESDLSTQRVIDFIRDRAAIHPPGHAAAHAPTGPAADSQPAPASIPGEPAERDSVDKVGGRVKTQKAGKVK